MGTKSYYTQLGPAMQPQCVLINSRILIENGGWIIQSGKLKSTELLPWLAKS